MWQQAALSMKKEERDVGCATSDGYELKVRQGLSDRLHREQGRKERE